MLFKKRKNVFHQYTSQDELKRVKSNNHNHYGGKKVKTQLMATGVDFTMQCHVQ